MLLTLLPLLFSVLGTNALDLQIDSSASICNDSQKIVDGILNYYEGLKYGGTVGMFSEPYYWWQSGEAFGSLVDFNYLCPGNSTLESIIHEGITTQLGSNNDMMVANFSTSEGNDDQGVWALTIMSAAEKGFPSPSNVSWAQVGVNIFKDMFSRWDDTCQGGIRWQIFPNNNNGYSYKNSISNGAMFTLATRLARYYNDTKYLYIADFIWSWAADIGFVVENSTDITVYDGGDISANCQDTSDEFWSYNYGVFMMGAAYFYNQTQEATWYNRVEKLLNSSIDLFFTDDGILYESQCQINSTYITCNNDQRSFRAIYARSLATTSILVPSLYDRISGLLESSAKAAAASCSGGSDNVTCGLDWSKDGWDGLYGLGEELSALEVIQNLLIKDTGAYATSGSNAS
ncbi:hypothetical protein DASC09_053640 [Saccharomycopsis crataegensis]|uniref:Mannan endo-1,6-alpha-mannosidase n=1 Tax=Saccharomycopsis crataegensis TaxID=43959 RepID=A0AAV5QU56_9ASCO|nr:hypothetical protein DASC09_053640 [Saccharomycopsis crataegensis]